MRHRLVVPSLLLLLAITATALPAQAGSPSATASAVIADNGDCTVTVTYTWSGFKGRDLTAQAGVRWAGPAGSLFWIWEGASPVTGSGTLSRTFDLTGYGSHTYYGFGNLKSARQRDLSGSFVFSPSGVSPTC